MRSDMSDYATIGEYKYSEKSGTATALTFLFIGVGIGTIVALLFAPKSGRQMRRTIKRRYEDARDVIDDFGEQAGEYADRGRQWANVAREKVAPIAKKMRRD
jgi:gas vesicle protein